MLRFGVAGICGRGRARRRILDRMSAPAECLGAVSVPLAPMRAVVGSLPGPDREAEYAYEPLWNGARVLAHLPGDGTVLLVAQGVDVTAAYPELAHLSHLLPDGLVAVLDGEVVAPDPSGGPSSVERIQERMCLHHPSAVSRALDELPVQLVVYDILYLGDGPTVHLPYTTRRALLDDLDLTGPGVKVPPY